MPNHLLLRLFLAVYLAVPIGWATPAWADELQTAAACFIHSPEHLAGPSADPHPSSAQRPPVAVQLEIADTAEARSTGLMHRKRLDDDSGMLFVFPGARAGHTGFWMYNTLIPLDIAFLDNDGYIVRVLSMVPCPHDRPGQCRSYRPDVSYRRAVEMNAGFFGEHQLREGDRLLIGDACLAGAVH